MKNHITIKDGFCFLNKSKIKAGDGLSAGKFPFYTSSLIQSKFINDYEIQNEALIFGTGGSASIHYSEGKFSTSTDCFVIQSNKKYEIDLKYLYFYLLSNMHLLENGFKGAGLKHISKKYIEEIEIPLLPIDTQKKIVEALDKAQALIDARKEQIRLMDELVKSRFVEMFGNGKYPLVKTQDVCNFITKGTTPKTNEIVEKYSEGLVPYLKVYNLSFDGQMKFNEKPQFIDYGIHSGSLSRSKVYPNDVLMNIVGPPLGKFSLVPNTFTEWNINQAIAIFRATSKVTPQFLLHSLMQPKVLKPFIDSAVGIRQQNLSLEQCRNLEIPLPPIDLQVEFTEFSKQINKLKLYAHINLDYLSSLYNAIQQSYFN